MRENRVPAQQKSPSPAVEYAGNANSRLSGVWKHRSEQSRSRTECAGNLPEKLTAPVPYGKAGCCTAEMRLPAAGGTPYRGTSPKKQKGQADRLSFLIIMPWAGSPGRPGRPRAVPPPLPGRRIGPAPALRQLPGFGEPPQLALHLPLHMGEDMPGGADGLSSARGLPAQREAFALGGRPGSSQSPASSPRPERRWSSTPAGESTTHTRRCSIRRGFFGGFTGRRSGSPEAQAAQNSRAGHSPHRGAPPGRQTIAPSSMSAWVKSPAAPSG